MLRKLPAGKSNHWKGGRICGKISRQSQQEWDPMEGKSNEKQQMETPCVVDLRGDPGGLRRSGGEAGGFRRTGARDPGPAGGGADGPGCTAGPQDRDRSGRRGKASVFPFRRWIHRRLQRPVPGGKGCGLSDARRPVEAL